MRRCDGRSRILGHAVPFADSAMLRAPRIRPRRRREVRARRGNRARRAGAQALRCHGKARYVHPWGREHRPRHRGEAGRERLHARRAGGPRRAVVCPRRVLLTHAPRKSWGMSNILIESHAPFRNPSFGPRNHGLWPVFLRRRLDDRAQRSKLSLPAPPVGRGARSRAKA